jgi:hypothetical protein
VEVNIVNEVATLQRLSVGQLRQRFAELFGSARAALNILKRVIHSGVAVLRALEISACALRSRGPPQMCGTSLDAAVVWTEAG